MTDEQLDLYAMNPQPAPTPALIPAPAPTPTPALGTVRGNWLWDGQQWAPIPRNRRCAYPVGREIVRLGSGRWVLTVPLACFALVLIVTVWFVQYSLLLALWSVLIFFMLCWRGFAIGFWGTRLYTKDSRPPGTSYADAFVPWIGW